MKLLSLIGVCLATLLTGCSTSNTGVKVLNHKNAPSSLDFVNYQINGNTVTQSVYTINSTLANFHSRSGSAFQEYTSVTTVYKNTQATFQYTGGLDYKSILTHANTEQWTFDFGFIDTAIYLSGDYSSTTVFVRRYFAQLDNEHPSLYSIEDTTFVEFATNFQFDFDEFENFAGLISNYDLARSSLAYLSDFSMDDSDDLQYFGIESYYYLGLFDLVNYNSNHLGEIYHKINQVSFLLDDYSYDFDERDYNVIPVMFDSSYIYVSKDDGNMGDFHSHASYVKFINERDKYSNSVYYGNGFDDGYSSGYNTGYDDGVAEGSSVGYGEGFDEGKDVGYTQGYNAGAESANHYTFGALFASIADTPVLIFRQLFSFDLFGVSALTVILSLFTVLVVLFVAKKIIK